MAAYPLTSMPLNEQLEAIYIGYYGRAADAGGLAYWESEFATLTAAGQSDQGALNTIANDFAPQPETLSLYPFLASPLTVLSTANLDTLVGQIYENLFGRAAQSGDTGYWVPLLQSGAVPLGQAILAIAQGATGTDASVLTAKIEVASIFTTDTGAVGLGISAPLSLAFTQEASYVVSFITPSNYSTVTSTNAGPSAVFINDFVSNQGEYLVTSSNSTVTLTDNVSHATTEGGSITFALNDASTPNGTTEHYTFTETGATLQVATGSGVLTMTNGQATLTVGTLPNVLGGGPQTLTLSVDGQTDQVTITEAQQTVTPASSSVSEGSSVGILINTTGISGALVAGTTESYTITSSSSPSALSQLSVSELSGTVTLNGSGQATVNVGTLATIFNSTSAPTFTLNLTNAGGVVSSSAVTINEAALLSATDNVGGGTPVKTTVGSQYVEATTGGSVASGSSVTFTVSEAGVPAADVAGTTLTYTLAGTGTALADVVGSTTGTLTLNSSGTASVTVQTLASTTVSGNLIFELNTNNVAGTPDVTDTVSVTAAPQSITAASTSVNEGSTDIFTVKSAAGAAAAGQSITYTITSASTPSALAQIPVGEQTGTITLNATGGATINVDTLATVFNSTSNPTFTVTLNNGASTLPTSGTITINEAALLSATDNVGGGTPVKTTVGNQYVETTTGGAIYAGEAGENGQTVTFTVSTAGVAGAAVAGTTLTYTLGGTAASEVVGPETGTLTLNANGTASLTVQMGPATLSTGTLIFSLNTNNVTGTPDVTDTVTVNAPAVNNFTPVVGETLIGGPEGTTFNGIIDLTLLGAALDNTLSYGVDVAHGAAGTNNVLNILVEDTNDTTVILGNNGPGGSFTNIQVVNVTDLQDPLDQAFNMQYFPDITTINMVASLDDYDAFYNVQKLVNVGVYNNDYSGEYDFYIVLTDAAAAAVAGHAPVTVTLDNAGEVYLVYEQTSGPDFVTQYNIANTGTNWLELANVNATTEITAVTGSTGSLALFFGDALSDLTEMNFMALGGAYAEPYQLYLRDVVIGNNNFTFYGAQGSTHIGLDVTQYSDNVWIETFSGANHIWVNDYDYGYNTITVYTGTTTAADLGSTGGYDSTFGHYVGANDATGDYVDLHNWESVDQYLNVYVGDGNNDVRIVSADYATVTVGADPNTATGTNNGDNTVDIYLWNGQIALEPLYYYEANGISWLSSPITSTEDFSWSSVDVALGNGNNTVDVNLVENGYTTDVGSYVYVTAGNGHNDIAIHSGYDLDAYVQVGNGNDNTITVHDLGGDYFGAYWTAYAYYGSDSGYFGENASAEIVVGTGSGNDISYHDYGGAYDDVYIYAGNWEHGGDTTAGGTIHVDVGAYSSPDWTYFGTGGVYEYLGSGEYTVHDHLAGSYSSLYLSALDEAGGGNTIYIGEHGSVYDNIYLDMGNGNNTIDVWQGSSYNDDNLFGYHGLGDFILIGNGDNTIDYNMYGEWDTLTIGPGSPTDNGNNDIYVDLYNSNETIYITVGNGNNDVEVYDPIASPPYTDNWVFITAGGGNNTIDVGLYYSTDSKSVVTVGATGSTGDNFITTWVYGDSPSSTTITMNGDGNNVAIVNPPGYGDIGDSHVTVTGGGGNDFIGVNSEYLPSWVTLNGEGGTNTLGLPGDVAALGVPPAVVAASIQNFQAVEFGTTFDPASTGAVADLLDLGPNNTINQVIFADNFAGTIGTPADLTGLNSGGYLDFLWADDFGQYMIANLGLAFSPTDTANILLDSQNDSSFHRFGNVGLENASVAGNVEIVNLTSTAAYGHSWWFGLTPPGLTNSLSLYDPGIQTLNINSLGVDTSEGTYHEFINGAPVVTPATYDHALAEGQVVIPGYYTNGDVYLDLNGGDLVGLTTINASTFQAGIEDTTAGDLGSSVATTVNAQDTSYDDLVFGNNGSDKAYLGNYENSVTMGNGGSDVVHLVQPASANIYGSYDGYNSVTLGNGGGDSVSIGNGSLNSVTLGNGNDDSVTLGNADENNPTGSIATYGQNTVAVGNGNSDSVSIGTSWEDTVTVGNGSNDTIWLGNASATSGFNDDFNTVTIGTPTSGGGGNSITIGNGTSYVYDNSVTINGSDTTGTAGASIDTVTFNGLSSGSGDNTITPNYASGTTINLGGHVDGDTIVFNHVTDSSFGYNDTITGFVPYSTNHAAGYHDVINLSAVDGANTYEGFFQANGALAVLGLANTYGGAGKVVIVYDYTDGTLYDFVGTNGSGASASNTLQVQVGVTGINHFTSADIVH